jgi:hypothetical protein
LVGATQKNRLEEKKNETYIIVFLLFFSVNSRLNLVKFLATENLDEVGRIFSVLLAFD